MPRWFKFVGYVAIAIVSFLLFLYWTFPYNVLKERAITAVEQNLGGDYEFKVGDLSSSFFTGVVLKDVKIFKRGDKPLLLWSAERVKVRASLGSILFGRLSLSFSLKSKGSRLNGNFKRVNDGYQVYLNIDKFDLADIEYFKNVIGLNLSSDIIGSADVSYNPREVVNSGGLNLELRNIELKKSEIDLGEGNKMPVPDLILAKGKESKINCKFSKGVGEVTGIHLVNGDLNLNLTGEIRFRSRIAQSALDFEGDFMPSAKMEQAIPLLYMIEKHKDKDGKYPLSIRGRLSKVKVSVGEVNLPF